MTTTNNNIHPNPSPKGGGQEGDNTQQHTTPPPLRGRQGGGPEGREGASSLKSTVAKGILWGAMSQGLMQVLGALFGLVLLNLLSPSDYGKIAVLLVYSNIAGNLQESGFVAALCNKRELTHADCNAVFWFGIIVSSVVYTLLWFAAPWIAEFNHEPVLTPLARYLFLGFVISSFGTVQYARLFRDMKVRQMSIISITALICSNIVGVTMAYMGYAFWGLATQNIMYTVVNIGLKWVVSPWRPTLPDRNTLRPAFKMFGFSSRLLITNLFNQLNAQVFSILLGRFFTAQAVGHYSNARKWNDMASNTVNGMITGVAQPALSKVADDDDRYRRVFRKMLRFVCMVSFPVMFTLALVSEEFIGILLKAEWQASAPLLSMLAIYGAFVPVTTLYSNMAISRGRSGINMFTMITLCILVWVTLLVTHQYGITVMVKSFVALNIAWIGVWQLFAWKIVRLNPIDTLKDILPFLIFTLISIATAWYAATLVDNIFAKITVKGLVAVVLYLAITYLSGAKIFREVIQPPKPPKGGM